MLAVAWLVLLSGRPAAAIPRVVVPGDSGTLHAASVDETMPLNDAVPTTGMVARAMGFGVSGITGTKASSALFVTGYQAVYDTERGTVNSFNGPGRFGWDFPTPVLSSSTQVVDGKPQPYSMGVSLMFRHHLPATQRIDGWVPLAAFAQLNQPWAFALMLRKGVPVLAHKQKNGTFFDLGSEAVGHQPTLRIDDGKWHHVVLNFWQPPNPNGCGGKANATCAGRGLLRLFVDGALIDEYYTDLTSNLRHVTVGALDVAAGEYAGQPNWQASPAMLYARGQIDDLAVYRRALTGDEIAKLEHRAQTGLIAVWPDPGPNEVGLSATTFPGASGESAVSPLKGFTPSTNPIFFGDPAGKGSLGPPTSWPPVWDLFTPTGISAAITVQPNGQKWLYVRKSNNAWFGIASISNTIWAVCGSGVFNYNSNLAGSYQDARLLAVGPSSQWYHLGVTQQGSVTRAYAKQVASTTMNCPAIPLLDGYDYARVDGEPAANPAKVARAMLFRRALGADELFAETDPGPTIWADPTQMSGDKVRSRAAGLLDGQWIGGGVPAGGVIDKNAAGVAKTFAYNIASSPLDPTVDDGADRPFTVAMRFRVDKVGGPDGNIVLARRGQSGSGTMDFEMRLRCSVSAWNGCRIYLLTPGSAHGQPSGQWRVDAPIEWGKEYGVSVSWPANGVVQSNDPSVMTVDLEPRVAVDGVLQNKVGSADSDHVLDINPIWKMWGNHNRPKPTGAWRWEFGGALDSSEKVALRDARVYPYAVQAVQGIYARCATKGCGETGQLCVDPGGGNEAASAICYGCDGDHTPVAGSGPVHVECRKKALFMDECVTDGDCQSGKCDSSTNRCMATDAVKTETICTEASEGSSLALGCPAGSVISAITYASYGTPNGTCGGALSNGSCHASTSLQKVKQACEGKPSCAIAANNAVFTDPCGGTAKRLVVQATCSSGKNGCDQYCFERGRSCDAAPGGYRCGNCISGFKRLPGYDKLPAHHPGLECTWAPYKKQGDLCAYSAECISGICGNSQAASVPYKMNTHFSYWNKDSYNGKNWTNFPDFDMVSIQSSRPTNVKICFGEDAKHCNKARYTPRTVTGPTPDCKNVSAYDCNEQCDSNFRELRWTVLSPNTCSDILRNTLSKWPGTDIPAYAQLKGPAALETVMNSFQSNALTLQDLKNVVLRDTSTYNPNVDYERLIKAGVGRVLIEYARTANGSAERNKLIAQYGQFGMLRECHWKGAYTGNKNHVACEPKLQPIGAVCPPPGEPDHEKHDFCGTNYCARDSKTCQFGDHPLLEPRPSAGNQDRQGKRDVKFGLVRLIDTTVEAQQTDKAVSNPASKYRYVADLTNAYCMRMFGAYVPPFPLLMSIFHLDRTKDEACSSYQFKAYVANKALTHGQPKALLGSCTGLKITDNTVCSLGECEFGPLITGNLSELADALLGSFTMTIGGAAPGCLPLEGTPVGELIDKLTILKTQTVGPVPLAVQFGPTLDICIDPLVDMASTGLPKITVRPSVALGVDARGGIGVAQGEGKSKAIKFWAGVQLLLTVVKLGFPVGWGIDVKDIPINDGSQPPIIWNLQISQRIGIDLEMFSGSFGLFAEVALGPFTVGFSIKLFEWTGLLFEWELSNVPLWSTKLDFGKPKVISTGTLPNHDHSGWFSGQTCNGLCK